MSSKDVISDNHPMVAVFTKLYLLKLEINLLFSQWSPVKPASHEH